MTRKPEDPARALATRLGLPFVDPLLAPVDPAVLWRLPREMALRYRILALGRFGDGVRLAMADPQDKEARRQAEAALRASLVVEVADEHRIRSAIERHYNPAPHANRMVQGIPQEWRPPTLAPTTLELDAQAVQERLRTGGARPYVDLLNFLLVNAIERGASDIHLDPDAEGLRVRVRVDGMLREILRLPTWAMAGVVSRVKVVGRLDLADRRHGQDGKAVAELGGRKVDLRISTVPSQFGETVVIRLLDPERMASQLDELGWAPHVLGAYRRLMRRPEGLILVVGPTGSGKTTTLYGTLTELRDEATAIVTLEDPIEYTLAGVSQIQVEEKGGVPFAQAIRNVLRQDPDVMVVGEIRDPDSAKAAIEAATTGHLVLSTLHSGQTIDAITRLLELEVPAYLVGTGLLGVIAQRLVRRVCAVCSIQLTTAKEDWDRLGIPPLDLGPDVRVAGPGCPHCQYAGYAGRQGVFELLEVNDDVREHIARSGGKRELLELARAAGFTAMLDDALDKVRRGITTVAEVARVVPVDPWRANRQAARTVLDASGPVELPGEARRERPLVLVAEPYAALEDALRQRLGSWASVEVLRHGEDLARRAWSDRPDAVVLGGSGDPGPSLDACRRLRSSPATAQVPLLFTPVQRSGPLARQALRDGATDVLCKPYHMEELELRLKCALRLTGWPPDGLGLAGADADDSRVLGADDPTEDLLAGARVPPEP